MGESYITRRGGGVTLNFRIRQFEIGTHMEDIEGRENEIAILTDVDIEGWQISFERPETTERGFLWLLLNNTANGMFNAIKKNTLQVGLGTAYQYYSGDWHSVDAKIYQSGVWVDFRTYLFREGMGQIIQWRGNVATFTDEEITVGATSGSKVGIATYDKFDFSNYSRLYIDLTPDLSTSNGYNLGITFSLKNTGSFDDYYSSTQGYVPSDAIQNKQYPPDVAPIINGTRSTLEIDIADAVKEAPCYLAIVHYYNHSPYAFKVHNIWLE